MNKKDMIEIVSKEAGITKVDAKKAVDVLIRDIGLSLVSNEGVQIPTIGVLKRVEKTGRYHYNVATKKMDTSKPYSSVKFNISKTLKEELNPVVVPAKKGRAKKKK